MIERLRHDPSLIVSGHRGYKSVYPENTLLAFEKALELGVHMLEFDLRLSQDKVLMVIHDDTVDRTTDGSGPVSSFTSEELRGLDAGSWFGGEFAGLRIPAFSELCELIAPWPELLLNVEIKPAPDAEAAADAAVAMLKDYGYLDRCVFTSFDANIIAHLHDQYGVKTQGFPCESMFNFVPGEHGTYSKMWAVGISMKQLTPSVADELRNLGLLAWCYCPDDDQDVYYALSCGVMTMTCNNPVPALEIGRLLDSRLRLDGLG